MTAMRQTIERDARREAAKWAEGQNATESLTEGERAIIESAFVAGYLLGRDDALREVSASLRFLPEGAWPHD